MVYTQSRMQKILATIIVAKVRVFYRIFIHKSLVAATAITAPTHICFQISQTIS